MTIFAKGQSIVHKLTAAGYCAYFAGGWVRDYLMGSLSQDIDIATSATPEQILALFPHTISVGIQFGVVVVIVEENSFEVATFRKDVSYSDGRRPEAIALCCPEEDAKRRDFTINGLFFNPLTKEIYDFVQGRKDIQDGVIRTIGNPYERFLEDRLRMIRAFRFSARFDFPIEKESKKAIYSLCHQLLPAVAMERIWQEFNKMASFPRFAQALIEMFQAGLLTTIFPELKSLSLEDLQNKVAPFPYFPLHTPTILYLMELFDFLSLEEKIVIALRLKVSCYDRKLIEFTHQLFAAFKNQDCSLQQWVYLLAHEDFYWGFHIFSARLKEEEKQEFVAKIQRLTQRLNFFIKRVQMRQPVVTAAHLQAVGIKPGKEMGTLLKEAEKIAIEQNLESAEPVLNHLKQSPLWIFR